MVFLLVVSLAFLSNCGGGGGGSSSSKESNGGTPPKVTSIKSPTQAKSVAAQVYQVGEFTDLLNNNEYYVIPSGTSKAPSSLSRIVSPALNVVVKKLPFRNTRNSINESKTCPYGGTVIYSGSYDNSTGDIDVRIQINNCDDGNGIANGAFQVGGNYTDSNNFNVDITVKQVSDSATYEAKHETDKTTVKNLALNIKATNNSAALTVEKGSLLGEWVDESVNYSSGVTFYNFKLTDIHTNTEEESTVNGIVTYNLSPESACEGLNGTYKYKTIVPVKYDKTNKLVISGDIQVK